MTNQYRGRVGGWRRPVSVPQDLNLLTGPVRGRLELPTAVHSSGPSQTFDLEDDDDLTELYQIVLTNGDEAAVIDYVDLVQLVRLWPRLRLPSYVWNAWSERLATAALR